MKRFYKTASLQRSDHGFMILLDQKPIRTPQKNYLLIPDETLAQSIAAEWVEQDEIIHPSTMPLTQILMTAQDITHHNRPRIIEEIVSYINTDLLCYRAPDITPHGQQQNRVWGHVISLLETYFATPILVTNDMIMLQQAGVIHNRVTEFLNNLDDILLTVFHILAQETGSVFLCMGFFQELINTHELQEAMALDDTIKGQLYREDLYGAAPDEERKRAERALFITAAARIISLLSPAK
jgi:chaperone required for assembly of F1-ATPase